MWDGAGHIQGVVEVVRDITEAKIAAERREQLEARMLRAQKYESLGTLAGGVAHDFNNLLMTILGGAELAAEDVGPGHRSYPSLKIIADAAVRAGDLSQQIMLYAGQRRRQLETVSLLELLRDLQPVFRAALPRRHPVELRGDPACPHIRVDVQQMRQLFMNLMVNASEALGDRDAPITLRTGCGLFDAGYLVGSSVNGEPVEGTYVYAEVTDAGDGMAPEVVRRIFDPFYTTREQGRGLGLAAVGGIVRAHRGAIVVNSRPGEGTTIRVLFPSAEDENPRANATGPESAQA
jgi:signal transduction histidine kinase